MQENPRIQEDRRTLSSSNVEELFNLNDNLKTIIDYERQLMRQRSALFLQVWKNRSLYQEFIEFMSFSKSSKFVGLLNIFYTIFLALPMISIYLSRGRTSAPSFSLAVLESVFLAFSFISGWLLYFCIVENPRLLRVGETRFGLRTKSDWKIFSDRVQGVLYLSIVCRHGLALIRRTLDGSCDSMAFRYILACNSGNLSRIFPYDSACVLMILPILFAVVYREARIGVNLVAWSIVLFSITFCCVLLESLRPLIFLMFYIILSFVIMADSFQQYLLFFWLGRQLKKTLEANQKLAEQNKASEMRNMIANVAHDLKTPLSSFMTGVDIIAADLEEFRARVESRFSISDVDEVDEMKALAFPSEYIGTFTSGLQSCIANIRNTNAFMLMTINRCLDYTKASNGLKLVPKNETIDLAEALKMPLQCMTNIQQKIKICLMPYAEQGICSHIITDNQWLQENVLCLLSNAVKYSAGGEVVIKVTKLTSSEGEKLGESVNRFLLTDKVCGTVEDEVISAEREYSCGPSPKNSLRRITSGWLKVGSSHLPDDSSIITRKSPRPQLKSISKVVPIADDLDANNMAQDGVETFNGENCVSFKGTEDTSDETFQEELMFEVIDTGIGISEEAMKTLFNPFKQTQRLAGGTGLGLYSLAKRIEALKGKYGVHQREDGKRGSVFWFTIPYKPDEISATVTLHSSRLNQESTTRISTLSSFSSSKCTPQIPTKVANQDSSSCALSVLLAEDTPSIAKMTTMMLRRQKHQTEVAENGQIVLDKLYSSGDERKYDVVLMDLQMPVMDGLEATRRIRAHERDNPATVHVSCSCHHPHHQHLHRPHHQIVIGVSANSDHETMEEALKAGIDDFLPKPFSVDAFMGAVKRTRERYCSSDCTVELL